VSRTLLREGFRRLEGVGLVTLQPNRGVVVRDFTVQEVEDVSSLRSALERAAIPLIIARLRPADLRPQRELQREFERACRTADMGGLILSNLAFHRRLSQISGNPFLYKSLEISSLQTQQIRYLAGLDAARVQTSMREHRQIVAALARRCAAAYEQAVLTHLAGGKADYQRIFPVEGDGQTAGGNSSDRGPRTRGAAPRKEGSHA
jgi:DNA-binding GntR family transcriptional regulator